MNQFEFQDPVRKKKKKNHVTIVNTQTHKRNQLWKSLFPNNISYTNIETNGTMCTSL